MTPRNDAIMIQRLTAASRVVPPQKQNQISQIRKSSPYLSLLKRTKTHCRCSSTKSLQCQSRAQRRPPEGKHERGRGPLRSLVVMLKVVLALEIPWEARGMFASEEGMVWRTLQFCSKVGDKALSNQLMVLKFRWYFKHFLFVMISLLASCRRS